MKVLLTSATSSEVIGGVEFFSEQLMKVFPDLSILDYTKSHKSLLSSLILSPVREPMKALIIGKYFLKLFKKNKPDLIFVNNLYGWYFYFKRIEIPVINILHGGTPAYADNALKHDTLDYFRIRYIYSFFENLSIKNAVRISNSNFTRLQVEKYYGADSKVIYNGVDAEKFRPVPKEDAREILHLPANKKIGIFVGRPSYSKGFDIILKLAEEHKDVLFLCIINPPVETRHENLVIKSKINQDELPLYYSSADFLIFPSRFEGFGYVPLEALACDTPIIASKTGILTEISPPGSWIIEGHDYRDYSNAIREMLNFERRLETRWFVKENFSFERFSRDYRRLVDDLLG